MIKLIASFFYIGYLPASGTFASAGAIGLFLLLREKSFYLQVLTAGMLFLVFLICGKAEKVFNEKDSHKIVIDEVSGMLMCCCFIPVKFFYALGVFCLFRIFDILKPFPINKLQELKGSAGVMLDDILAAFYALGVVYFIDYIRLLNA